MKAFKKSDNSPKVICLTPVRNESWVIKPFLAASKMWADHVIAADQGSTDGTLELLQSTRDVETIMNAAKTYDERHRQRLLVDKAREIPGKRILIALDADEILSANCSHSDEWTQIISAKPGTILRFRWVNILTGFKHAWIRDEPVPLGFVDDGSAQTELDRIHNPRLPQPENAPVLDLKEIVVLHFQYVIWERMLSKQRWYQAWEHLNYPRKSLLDIYRKYNHMNGSWDENEIHPVKPEWLEGYDRAGIDFRNLTREPVTWWDPREGLEMLQRHGTRQLSPNSDLGK